ncbi:hypothetical protein G5V59_27460 [Nocardioides sp. W3-2-3]|uniref:hypothetical protein n=1 Tax=Nocardioides convexus TaxID=2712224 RepID=UPI00241866B3|nr:hypothetical protein [Nocardioides convexus]NHA02121.1 hypothetical protein [Nocardioides convexus]
MCVSLLFSTVGADEAALWAHRTEPLNITLFVDEFVDDVRHEVWQQYEAAQSEIQRRYDAADAARDIDDERYLWIYDRTESGDFIARDPAAPTWSWDAWRAGIAAAGAPDDFRAAVEESLRTGVGLYSGRPGDATTAYIAKSPEPGRRAQSPRRGSRPAPRDDRRALRSLLEKQRVQGAHRLRRRLGRANSCSRGQDPGPECRGERHRRCHDLPHR